MPKFSHPFLLFVLIVVCSAAFRITNLDYIEFKGDEAANLYFASRPLFGHSIPPFSTTSSMNIPNPPLINYILFPLTAISTNPKSVSFFIGLLNSLSVGFFFLLVKKYYNLTTAFVAGLLLAFSPWSIIYSRKIWAQDLILPLLIPLLLSIHKLIIEKKPAYWALYTFISLLLIQLHQPNLFFVLLSSALLVIQKVKMNSKYILIGGFAGIIPFIPYLIYQISNNCSFCEAVWGANQRLSKNYDLILFFRPLQIMSQGNFQSILGEDMLAFSTKFPIAYNLRRLFYFEYILFPASLVVFWIKYVKTRFFVYIIILLPFLYFVFQIVPHIHYFVILTPFLFLVLAAIFSALFKNRSLLLKYISALIFTLLIIASVVFNWSFISLVKKQKKLQGDYGQAYIFTEKEAIKSLEKYKNSENYEERFISSFVPKEYLE